VNCAALAPGVLASELFGHEAGAFTGAAAARPGRFEVAHQGTLLLDEIAEVPPETQVLLLRVLQERVIERVGSSTPIPVDVRVLAATNRDLQAGVAEGWFRADLFYRLHVFPLRLPPLRERSEDVPELVRAFVERLGRRLNRSVRQVSPRTLDLLGRYHWPGNVRELENLARRLAALYPQETITTAVIEAELSQPTLTAPGEPSRNEDNLSVAVERYLAQYFSGFEDNLPPPGLYHRILREVEGPLLSAALAATRGNQIRAADLLGVNRNTLRKKIRDLEIQVYRTGGG